MATSKPLAHPARGGLAASLRVRPRAQQPRRMAFVRAADGGKSRPAEPGSTDKGRPEAAKKEEEPPKPSQAFKPSSSDYSGDWGRALDAAAKEAKEAKEAPYRELTPGTLSSSLDEYGKPKTGLRGNPLSGGVKNATARFELPSPPVAVRNLVEQAQFGHLCTTMSNMHHRRAGFPFGCVVDFACDGAGNPIFSLSPLAMHTRNILADSRCSLVVTMPGWQGLSNARVTIFGDVYPLPEELQDDAHEIFRQKHQTEGDQEWIGGNHSYFRMHRISDIYFVGGFGTVTWVEVPDYVNAKPDPIVINRMQLTMQTLNEHFSGRVKELVSTYENHADDAAIISIDKRGIDVRVRFGHDYCVERVTFLEEVHTLDKAISVMEAVTATPEGFALHNRSIWSSVDLQAKYTPVIPVKKNRDQ